MRAKTKIRNTHSAANECCGWEEVAICPMYHKLLCDENGNYYDKIDCALCKGLDKDEGSLCEPLQTGVVGTESPKEGVMF